MFLGRKKSLPVQESFCSTFHLFSIQIGSECLSALITELNNTDIECQENVLWQLSLIKIFVLVVDFVKTPAHVARLILLMTLRSSAMIVPAVVFALANAPIPLLPLNKMNGFFACFA